MRTHAHLGLRHAWSQPRAAAFQWFLPVDEYRVYVSSAPRRGAWTPRGVNHGFAAEVVRLAEAAWLAGVAQLALALAAIQAFVALVDETSRALLGVPLRILVAQRCIGSQRLQDGLVPPMRRLQDLLFSALPGPRQAQARALTQRVFETAAWLGWAQRARGGRDRAPAFRYLAPVVEVLCILGAHLSAELLRRISPWPLTPAECAAFVQLVRVLCTV